MIDFDLEYLEEELDDISLVLALKMIELRIYNDISYTEEEMANFDDFINVDDKGKVFLSKIRWFREWINFKNSNLLEAGLTDLDNMEMDDILNAVIVNDSAGFKRRRIFKEATTTPIYMTDDEIICNEDEYANEYYTQEMRNKLMIK